MNDFNIRAFNPQPEPPANISRYGFNPQPEPPPFNPGFATGLNRQAVGLLLPAVQA